MEQEPLPISELVADPDGFIRRVQATGCPFAQTEIGPMAFGHEAVRSLARSPHTRPALSQVLAGWGITSGPFYEWISQSALDMEGEEHRQWRRLMSRIFTPHSVEKLRPSIRAQAAELARALAGQRRCEFIQDYARKLPAIGLCELIGVPAEDRSEFTEWADTIGLGFNAMLAPSRIADIDAALQALLDYAGRLIAARRRLPQDDFISGLIQVADETGALDAERLQGTVAGLVFAGHETTKNQLGWMVVVLSEFPAEWDRVAREPERATAVIEELLRFRSTATGIARVVLEDFELLGQRFSAGSPIVASLWAANRDPAEFANPHAFDVDANAGGMHMAFGQGVHHCLGAALARLELQEGLRALSAHLTCPTLEAGAEFLPPLGITGPVRLPIRYAARQP